MKNEEIVAKLRNVLQDGPYIFVAEPLVASKYEHKFIISKDIPDCNDKMSINIILQFTKTIPQVVIDPEPKTTMRPKDGDKEITINFVPFVISLTDNSSYGEIMDYISNISYNVSDILHDYTVVNDIASIEPSIVLETKGLYNYNITLPEAKMGIVYDTIDDGERTAYIVLHRFDRRAEHVKTVDSLTDAIATIKELYPKDISECWWRLDINRVFTKLFNISEPKMIDNCLYTECIGEFKLPTNPKLEYKCWLKVTKNSITETSKLYLESSSLSPYIHIKISLDGYDDIVYKAYEMVNRINTIADIIGNMTIGLECNSLYQKLSVNTGHIDILCKSDSDLLISYWANGVHTNIWVTYTGYNKPRITIGNRDELYIECHSIEQAILKAMNIVHSTK